MKLSKIDIADAHLCAAIRMFFEDSHPVPVHTLAGAAREILNTLGEKLRMDTFLGEIARWKGVPVEEERRKATRYVNFMEHADRDPAKPACGLVLCLPRLSITAVIFV